MAAATATTALALWLAIPEAPRTPPGEVAAEKERAPERSGSPTLYAFVAPDEYGGGVEPEDYLPEDYLVLASLLDLDGGER